MSNTVIIANSGREGAIVLAEPEVAYGSCECGCGTPVSGDSHGRPRRFIFGHQCRKYPQGYREEDRGHETPCHIWTGYIGSDGYGRGVGHSRYSGSKLAHIQVWEKLKGRIAKGKTLDHLCRVTECISLGHLQEVTQNINVQRGDLAKLDAQVVEAMRWARSDAGLTYGEIAEQFGISYGHAWAIITGKYWKSRAAPYPKQRKARGKLTQKDVDEIRRLADEKGLGCGKLSTQFGISRMQISNILRNKSWATSNPEEKWGQR